MLGFSPTGERRALLSCPPSARDLFSLKESKVHS